MFWLSEGPCGCSCGCGGAALSAKARETQPPESPVILRVCDFLLVSLFYPRKLFLFSIGPAQKLKTSQPLSAAFCFGQAKDLAFVCSSVCLFFGTPFSIEVRLACIDKVRTQLLCLHDDECFASCALYGLTNDLMKRVAQHIERFGGRIFPKIPNPSAGLLRSVCLCQKRD